jgi:hypothetical protein
MLMVAALLLIGSPINYANRLIGSPITSAGRAQFSMQLEKYDVVPPQIQQKIVAEKAVA